MHPYFTITGGLQDRSETLQAKIKMALRRCGQKRQYDICKIGIELSFEVDSFVVRLT